MEHHLVAVAAFAQHAVGDIIRDAEQIVHALQHHAAKVVRIPASEAPLDAGKED